MPLNEIQLKHGPFAKDVSWMRWPGRDHVLTCGVDDRIKQVKESTDADWLKAVIRDRDVQATVRIAAERRLRNADISDRAGKDGRA
jgi:hypothetical protein